MLVNPWLLPCLASLLLLFVIALLAPLHRYRVVVGTALTTLHQWARSGKATFPIVNDADPIVGEMAKLARHCVELERDSERHHVKLQLYHEQATIAQQVAHDIRSPLAAFEIARQHMKGSNPDIDELLSMATSRVREIADKLLLRFRQDASHFHKGKSDTASTATWLDVKQRLARTCAAKRFEFSAKKVSVNFFSSLDLTHECGPLDPSEVETALSNLVNNAHDAMQNGGTVDVHLGSTEGRVFLSVQDSGKGMPAEILRSIGERGVTHGKSNGNGLGVYHARQVAEGCGGEFKIKSLPGKGTTVQLFFPASSQSQLK